MGYEGILPVGGHSPPYDSEGGKNNYECGMMNYGSIAGRSGEA